MSATEATIQTFNFKIIAPKNETITVTMGDGTVYTVKGTDTESVTKDDLKIAYGTKWSATVSAEGSSGGTDSSVPEKETEFNLNKDGSKTSITIPAGVKVIKLCAYAYADSSTQGISSSSYILNGDKNELVSAEALSDNGGENPGYKSVNYMNVIPGKTYDFYCYALSSDIGTDADVSISYSKEINSYYSSSSTSTTAGNLIVNGVDTGSTTGSGTVTGIVSVSAGAATENTIFDGCQWEYTEVNSETTKNTFEETDENYNFGFTTCKNTKYLFIVAGGNLENSDDIGSCSISLFNEKMIPYKIDENQTSSSLSYGVDARILVEVSPNKKYYTSASYNAEYYGFYEDAIIVTEIDPETVTINSDGKTANADSLTNAGVIQYKNISFYRCL